MCFATQMSSTRVSVFSVERLIGINMILDDLLCKRKQREYYCFSFTRLSGAEMDQQGNDKAVELIKYVRWGVQENSFSEHYEWISRPTFCSSALTCFYFNKNKTKKSIIYTNEQLTERKSKSMYQTQTRGREETMPLERNPSNGRSPFSDSMHGYVCGWGFVRLIDESFVQKSSWNGSVDGGGKERLAPKVRKSRRKSKNESIIQQRNKNMLNRLLFESFWWDAAELMGERISEDEELEGGSLSLGSAIGSEGVGGGDADSTSDASTDDSLLVSGFWAKRDREREWFRIPSQSTYFHHVQLVAQFFRFLLSIERFVWEGQ